MKKRRGIPPAACLLANMYVGIVPVNQPAAFGAGMLLRLPFHPRRHALRLHLREVWYHPLVVTDTVPVVPAAEGF